MATPDVSDRVLFRLVERFFSGDGATEISKWLASEHGLAVSREQVYPLIREAVKRGRVVLVPPREKNLRNLVAKKYELDPARVDVVDVEGPQSQQFVAAAAADLAFSILKQLKTDQKVAETHIGLGPGSTGLQVAHRLAQHLSSEDQVPDLVIHALTAGFAPMEPLASPIAHFGLFKNSIVRIRYEALFCAGVMKFATYAKDVRKTIGLGNVFEAAKQIRLIVTSLGASFDEHSRFNRMMDVYATPAEQARLTSAGYVGDLQYRPFGQDGPIDVDTGIRAVTVFELEDFRRMIEQDGGRVILVAAPCAVCNASKMKALLPLLRAPALRSLWSDLVIDCRTAAELLTDV